MRKYLLVLCCMLALPAFAQMPDSIKVEPKDVESHDAILAALYDVISGPAGHKRNWNRMRSLFLPGGKLMGTGKRPDGTIGYRVMSVDDYINLSGPVLEKNGFFEREIARRTERFGAVLHAFSTYEARQQHEDTKLLARGINSIQLFNDGKRWWVVSVFWMAETPDMPVPAEYLRGK